MEPSGELLDVVRERSPGMVCQIMCGEEAAKQGRLVYPDRNTGKNIITTIFHRLSPTIGHKVDGCKLLLG
jgi:hypothetical protein